MNEIGDGNERGEMASRRTERQRGRLPMSVAGKGFVAMQRRFLAAAVVMARSLGTSPNRPPCKSD